MRSRGGRPKGLLAAAIFTALLASGCGATGPVEEGAIEPAAPAEASTEAALGPGVRPLSLGPGDKSSPRVSPSGDRLAFVLDGAVVDKSLHAQDATRRTPEGFSASNVGWLSPEILAFLGPGPGREPSAGAEDDGVLFVVPTDDPEAVEVLAGGVQATGAQAGGGSVVAAARSTGADGETTLVRVRSSVARRFPTDLRGTVSDLSLSPDGREVAMAVTPEAPEGRVEISTYRFSEGRARRAALLDEGLEVTGAPQRTSRGIYFVAGVRGGEEGDYALYRVRDGAEGYEPVRGVGEDFVPASIAASPDGESLAVLGRRSSRSPTDLYVLDLGSDALEAVTTNENMEIRTKPRDLSWSPDGTCALIVARGALSSTEVYGTPAEELSSAFYNVYRVPVGPQAEGAGRGAG